MAGAGPTVKSLLYKSFLVPFFKKERLPYVSLKSGPFPHAFDAERYASLPTYAPFTQTHARRLVSRWDFFQLVTTIPGEQAFGPLNPACSLVAKP